MTETDRILFEDYMNTVLKLKYKDIVAHLDIHGDDAVVSCFWNRRTNIIYNEAKSFKFKASDFNKVLAAEIKPFFGV